METKSVKVKQRHRWKAHQSLNAWGTQICSTTLFVCIINILDLYKSYLDSTYLNFVITTLGCSYIFKHHILGEPTMSFLYALMLRLKVHFRLYISCSSLYIYSNIKTMNTVIFWRNYYPQQRIGEVDSTPGCHHTHQQWNRNHRASDASQQPEGNKLRRLHHPFRLNTVTQLSACRLNIHILLNTVEHGGLKRFSKKCSKSRQTTDR